MRRFELAWLLPVAAAIASLALAAPATAQDFFIPGQPKGGAPAGPRVAPAPVRRAPPPAPPAPPPVVAAPLPGQADGTDQGQGPGTGDQAQPALPPEPELPPLAKGTAPPAAVIGVMGVPEVMRASSAAQQVERAINERRQKLNEDAQKEQGAWRDMQQALVADRGKLSPEQVRVRERDLQERITNSQKQFRERGRIIQLAGQYALAQIERTLVSVIRQVAESRGMNLVLHRQQVALNVNEFDITEQVAEQMNKVLASVVIPPDGVVPPTLPATPPVAASPGAAPGATTAAGIGTSPTPKP